MHQDIALLPDAKRPVRSLVLHGRIPPAVEVDDMAGGRQVQPGAACLERQDEEGRAVVALERFHQLPPLPYGGASVEHEPGTAEHALKMLRQRRRDLAKLREYQRLLLPLGQFLAQRGQPLELAASLRIVTAVPQPLRGMIADLLQARQMSEDDPTPLDSLHPLELLRQLAHRLLIQRGLPLAQTAERLDFGLFRQVRDHALVGLQSPQNVGAHQGS